MFLDFTISSISVLSAVYFGFCLNFSKIDTISFFGPTPWGRSAGFAYFWKILTLALLLSFYQAGILFLLASILWVVGIVCECVGLPTVLLGLGFLLVVSLPVCVASLAGLWGAQLKF
jgi:hypothetical protein